jgi:hypothetical protein
MTAQLGVPDRAGPPVPVASFPYSPAFLDASAGRSSTGFNGPRLTSQVWRSGAQSTGLDRTTAGQGAKRRSRPANASRAHTRFVAPAATRLALLLRSVAGPEQKPEVGRLRRRHSRWCVRGALSSDGVSPADHERWLATRSGFCAGAVVILSPRYSRVSVMSPRRRAATGDARAGIRPASRRTPRLVRTSPSRRPHRTSLVARLRGSGSPHRAAYRS